MPVSCLHRTHLSSTRRCWKNNGHDADISEGSGVVNLDIGVITIVFLAPAGAVRMCAVMAANGYEIQTELETYNCT